MHSFTYSTNIFYEPCTLYFNYIQLLTQWTKVLFPFTYVHSSMGNHDSKSVVCLQDGQKVCEGRCPGGSVTQVDTKKMCSVKSGKRNRELAEARQHGAFGQVQVFPGRLTQSSSLHSNTSLILCRAIPNFPRETSIYSYSLKPYHVSFFSGVITLYCHLSGL